MGHQAPACCKQQHYGSQPEFLKRARRAAAGGAAIAKRTQIFSYLVSLETLLFGEHFCAARLLAAMAIGGNFERAFLRTVSIFATRGDFCRSRGECDRDDDRAGGQRPKNVSIKDDGGSFVRGGMPGVPLEGAMLQGGSRLSSSTTCTDVDTNVDWNKGRVGKYRHHLIGWYVPVHSSVLCPMSRRALSRKLSLFNPTHSQVWHQCEPLLINTYLDV